MNLIQVVLLFFIFSPFTLISQNWLNAYNLDFSIIDWASGEDDIIYVLGESEFPCYIGDSLMPAGVYLSKIYPDDNFGNVVYLGMESYFVDFRELSIDAKNIIHISGFLRDSVKLLGTTYFATGVQKNIFYAKFSADLTLVQFETWAGGQMSKFFTTFDGDNNMFILGSFYEDVRFGNATEFANRYSSFLVKIKDGDVKWLEKLYEQLPFGITIDLMGNPVVLVSGYIDPVIIVDGYENKVIFTKKYNRNTGNMIWSEYIDPTNTFECSGIDSDPSGNIVICGSFVDELHIPDKASLAAIDFFDSFVLSYGPEGNFRWVQHIGGYGDEDENDLKIDKEGYTYVCGDYEDEILIGPNIYSNQSYKGWYARLDTSGNVTDGFAWTGAYESDTYYGIVLTNKYGLIGGDSFAPTLEFGGHSVWQGDYIAKFCFDSINSECDVSQTKIFHTPSVPVSVFPNPSKDWIGILNLDNIGRYEFKLSDLMGVCQEVKMESDDRLDISSLSPGIYHLYMGDKEANVVFESKFVKL